jgi:hypothetical protein
MGGERGDRRRRSVPAAVAAVLGVAALAAGLVLPAPGGASAATAAGGLPKPLHQVPDRAPMLDDRPISAASVVLDPPRVWYRDLPEVRLYGVVSADGREYRLFDAMTEGGRLPMLSPDGRRIAWWSGAPDRGPGALQVRRTDGSAVMHIAVPDTGGPPDPGAPGRRGPDEVDVQWYPDGRRLLLTGRTADLRPAAWVADADAGVARLLCRCGDRLVLGTSGALAAVPRPADPIGDPPRGAVRLPRMDLVGPLVARPDARAWVTVAPGRGRLLLGETRRGVRELAVGGGRYQPDRVLAWTADGIWVTGGDLGLATVDPASGALRVVTPPVGPGVTVVGLATSLAAGARTVPAAQPLPDPVPEGSRPAWLTLLVLLLVWFPTAVLTPPGYVLAVGLLVAYVAVHVHRSWERRTRRRRLAERRRAAAAGLPPPASPAVRPPLRLPPAVVVLGGLAVIVLLSHGLLAPAPRAGTTGPQGLPAVVRAVPPGAPDVREEPIEAASVVVDGDVARTFGVVAADGGAHRTLEAGTARDDGPALSPDGRLVAWVPERGREVRVLRLDTGREVALTVPADAVEAVRWFPDSARVLVAGHTAAGPVAWTVTASGGGTPVEACRCAFPLLSPAGALVVAVPPPPPAYAGGGVAAGPDGASWAYVDPVAGRTVVAGAAGERRVAADDVTGHAPRYLLAWTREGVWVGRDGGVDRLDPATGRYTPAFAVDTGVSRVRSIAVDLAPFVISAPEAAAVATRPWYRRWPAAVAALLAGLAVALAYRTRRMRAMHSAPAAASTREPTKSAR